MSLIQELAEAGALIQGEHFVYSRGQHGPDYVRIDALLSPENEGLLYRVCGKLALPFQNSEVEAVTACADDRCGGLASFTAEHLGVKAASGQKLKNKRTLIAEDVLTTGGGVIMVREEAESYGANIIGASIIVNRGGVTQEALGVPRLASLANAPMLAFDPDQCGLCADNVSIVEDIGRGSAYKLDHPDYAGGYQQLLVTAG